MAHAVSRPEASAPASTCASTSISALSRPAQPAYEGALAHLFQRAGAGIKLGLEPVAQLLELLGAPHRAGPRFVVVAGTNGKGSTASLIAGALGAAGHRTGLFTSPHLLRFTERIRIAGREIEAEQVLALYERLRAVEAACVRPPTFFECATAMALGAFADAQVDVAVLEVGLGGRLDATNVVSKALAVITPIGLDHQHLLGDRVDQIAAEKAAIIPTGGEVVVAPQAPAASAVIDRVAAERRAVVHRVTPVSDDADRPRGAEAGARGEVEPAYAPPFTRQNRATARLACERLDAAGISCPPAAFSRATGEFAWPARYQWLADPPHPDLLLDVAHNPAGTAALLAGLASDPRARDPASGAPRPVHCVFSSLQDKPAATHASLLRQRVRQLYLCPIPVRRGLSGTALAEVDPSAPVYPDVATAIAAAREAARADGGLVLITGSIFLLAEALALLTGAWRDPPVPF